MSVVHLLSDAEVAMLRMAGEGREYALPTGRFREAGFHWPLCGDEFEERTDATRPVSDDRFDTWDVRSSSRNGHRIETGVGSSRCSRFGI